MKNEISYLQTNSQTCTIETINLTCQNEKGSSTSIGGYTSDRSLK